MLGTGTRILVTNDNFASLETDMLDTHDDFISCNEWEIEELDCSKQGLASSDLGSRNLSWRSVETEATEPAAAATTGRCMIPDKEPMVVHEFHNLSYKNQRNPHMTQLLTPHKLVILKKSFSFTYKEYANDPQAPETRMRTTWMKLVAY